MIDTIFAPAFGNRPSALIGRDILLNEIKECMHSMPGSKERAVIILGQRGSGKTVLLWEIADIAEKENYIVARPTVTVSNMLDIILEKVQDASLGLFGFSAGVDIDTVSDENKSFNYKIVKIARELTKNKKGLLLLIDELQSSADEVRQLIISYQEMVGEGLNVALVMAGLHASVSNVLNDKVLTFLNRAKKENLAPLNSMEIYYFMEKSFKKLGIDISEEILELLVENTEGSPYMMQLLGHSVVLMSEKGDTITREAAQMAINRSKKEFINDVCGTSVAALSERDRDFIYAMVSDEDISDINDISARMGVTQDYARKYRSRLVDAGIIEVVRRGKVRYAVPLLREYLLQQK